MELPEPGEMTRWKAWTVTRDMDGQQVTFERAGGLCILLGVNERGELACRTCGQVLSPMDLEMPHHHKEERLSA